MTRTTASVTVSAFSVDATIGLPLEGNVLLGVLAFLLLWTFWNRVFVPSFQKMMGVKEK